MELTELNFQSVLNYFNLRLAFEPQEIKKIPLEAAVDRFYEEQLPSSHSQSRPYLTLRLGFNGDTSQYHHSFRLLHLNLDSPLVQEIYKLLETEKGAKIEGELIAGQLQSSFWHMVMKPARMVYGNLNGKLVVGDNNYFTLFTLNREDRFPHLEKISRQHL